MSDSVTFQISIPSDTDGYILLRCEHCGTYFKIPAEDVEDNRLLYLYCPSCGLTSEHYLTQDVIELAEAMCENYINDIIFDAFKNLERKLKHSPIQVKMGHRPTPIRENPIRTGIEAMEIASFKCWHRSAKIMPLLIMTGCYCPFCGVKEYEVE